MDEAMVARYWCHMCSQMVDPIMEAEMKCPFCQSGFIEEMEGGSQESQEETDLDIGSDRALSLWAPILLGMMGNPRRRRRFRHMDFSEEDDGNESEARSVGETELDRELESILRRRRRSSATILQLLQGIRAGIAASETENSENGRDADRGRDRDGDRDRERERERVILINPYNNTIILQGGQNQDSSLISLGDYFIGPGLDMLLQHLAENDPNRYGTPPAQKEAVEAMPSVRIQETLQCSVCLDDFEIGTEAKEMPCKHKFHDGCIMPWLEMHSSCPVCRYQLPADESKFEAERSRNGGNQRESGNDNHATNTGGDGDAEVRSPSNRRFSIPWPFNGLFSGSNSSSTSSGSQSGSSAHREEN